MHLNIVWRYVYWCGRRVGNICWVRDEIGPWGNKRDVMSFYKYCHLLAICSSLKHSTNNSRDFAKEKTSLMQHIVEISNLAMHTTSNHDLSKNNSWLEPPFLIKKF